MHFKMLSAISFNLDESKIFLSGNGLKRRLNASVIEPIHVSLYNPCGQTSVLTFFLHVNGPLFLGIQSIFLACQWTSFPQYSVDFSCMSMDLFSSVFSRFFLHVNGPLFLGIQSIFLACQWTSFPQYSVDFSCMSMGLFSSAFSRFFLHVNRPRFLSIQ